MIRRQRMWKRIEGWTLYAILVCLLEALDMICMIARIAGVSWRTAIDDLEGL